MPRNSIRSLIFLRLSHDVRLHRGLRERHDVWLHRSLRQSSSPRTWRRRYAEGGFPARGSTMSGPSGYLLALLMVEGVGRDLRAAARAAISPYEIHVIAEAKPGRRTSRAASSGRSPLDDHRASSCRAPFVEASASDSGHVSWSAVKPPSVVIRSPRHKISNDCVDLLASPPVLHGLPIRSAAHPAPYGGRNL